MAKPKVKTKSTRKETREQKPGGGDGLVGGVVSYLRDTRSELRKVVWPTREEATNLTVIVLAVTILMTVILGGIDYLFGVALDLILRVFS